MQVKSLVMSMRHMRRYWAFHVLHDSQRATDEPIGKALALGGIGSQAERVRGKEREAERDGWSARAFQLLHQAQQQATLFFETILSQLTCDTPLRPRAIAPFPAKTRAPTNMHTPRQLLGTTHA